MKTLKAIRIILFLIFLALTHIQAQDQSKDAPPKMPPVKQEKIGYGKISGTVVDEKQESVPFAAISLKDATTEKIIDGTVSDDKGHFVIKSIVEGKYLINISFIGYETFVKGPYEFTGKGDIYSLGSIAISRAAVTLDEVVVEGQRELIEDKVDRIVYNAEQDKSTAGGDATDVLRRVPLLSVDLDGNVSLRGSSNIKVLIDGRPSAIMASNVSDALKQIPADQIKSVEVITSPSARYDAEGTAGIINIITKKNDLQGASLSMNSNVGYTGSSLGLNGSYRKNRINLSLGGFGRSVYNLEGEYENNQNIRNALGGETVSITHQQAETDNKTTFGIYNFGADYAINKYNWVGGSVKFGLFNVRQTQDNRLTETMGNDGTLSSVEDVLSENLSNNMDVSLNYVKTFEKKGKELSFLTLFSQNTLSNNFTIERLSSNHFESNNSILNENKGFNKEYTVQLDFVEPLSDKIIFEAGAKNIARDVTSDFVFNVRNDEGEFEPVMQNELNNNFKYLQNVVAAYVSSTFELSKGFNVMIGSRYEYTMIDATFADNEQLDVPKYGIFAPSLNMSKKIGKTNTIKFAYNRRIQRPSLQFLNPNINASNPLNILQGNPSLEPEFTNNIEVSYSTFKNGKSFNFSAYARNTSGSIQQVRETLGQDTIFSTYRNIGQEDAYGIGIFGNVRIGRFSMNGGVDTYYAILNNNLEDPIYSAANKGFVLNGKFIMSYELTKKYILQSFFGAKTGLVQLQGMQGGFHAYSLNLNRNFSEKKGSIGIGIENFLQNGLRVRSEINSPLLHQENVNVTRNFNVKLNFSYRIGKMTAGPQQPKRKSIQNNDLKNSESNDVQ